MNEEQAIIQKAEDTFGRTLSPIEAMTLIELSKSFSFDVLAEAINLSKGKNKPILYLKKICYNIKNPLEPTKKKEEEPKEEQGSKWLEDFKNELRSKEN